MGYTHYWRRRPELDSKAFKAINQDFRRISRHLRLAGVVLAGPFGDGEPIFTDDVIAFNGPEKCGHDQRDLGITWPVDTPNPDAYDDEAGQWFAGATLNRRTCGGDCSHETFRLDRIFPIGERETPENGMYFNFCKTAYKPYDLAVCCLLIIAKQRLSDAITVSSDGDAEQWRDAAELCQHVLYKNMQINSICPIG